MYAMLITDKQERMMKVIVAVIVTIVYVAVIATRFNQLINPPAVNCEADSVVVVYGDTYWNLEDNANCTGGHSKEDRVDQIIQLNGGSSILQHGQVIYFP